MVATNVFNNALSVPLDEYLEPFRTGRGTTVSEFAGKVALITGAAHGQGRATALALAAEGAPIAAFDVARPLSYPGYALGTADDLESLAAACRTAGGDCLTFAGDVRDDAAVAKAVADGARAVRPDRHPLQQRRDLRLRPGPRADRGRVGRDARHQPEGRLAGGAAGDPGDDRARSPASSSTTRRSRACAAWPG